MAASKRNAGVPSALAARQSLNDEELVSSAQLLIVRSIKYNVDLNCVLQHSDLGKRVHEY